MNTSGIRSRILVAAMLPVTLVVALLVSAFLTTGLDDDEHAHRERVRFLAQQLAASCEYGLFSANTTQLQSVARAAVRESELRSIVILNAADEVMASAGVPGYRREAGAVLKEGFERNSARGTDLLIRAIQVSPVLLNDLYEPQPAGEAGAGRLLGHVLVEVSNLGLKQRQSELIRLGLLLALAGLLLGGLLALRLGRRVMRPVARVSSMIERIGRGDLAVRTAPPPRDPLRDLHLALNQMAQSLQSGRDDMERRIALATGELRAKKEEAEAATLAKSRFLAAASHDLRQPTHALGMFVTRLEQLPHDAEAAHLIASMNAAVQAMRDLLDGLLDISRLEAGVVPVQMQTFAINEIFDKLRPELAMIAADKGLRLRIRPSAAWLVSDPALLHRILLNLLGNSLRYTRSGGVLLACRFRADGEQARIEVWDSGIGIAQEHQQAVFQEFFQVDNQERDRGKGMGLGLYIVQRTAQLLGHPLQLWSRPGQGTRFRIDVPLAISVPSRERRGSARSPSFDDLTNLVVQVIEDDELVRSGLVNLLLSWGTTVLEAPDLASALDQLRQGPVPAVIISDFRLPDGENGIEAVRQLRLAAGREIAAFLISGDTDPALLRAAREVGLVLLHKSVRPAKLRSLIGRLAQSAQAADDLFL